MDERTARREALKQVAAALRRGAVPFALAGGYAAWVHGAPEPEHDVDLIVAAADRDAALAAVAAAGLVADEPPEDWLVKVPFEGAVVDVLHRLAGHDIGPEQLARATEREVLSVRMPVSDITDVLIGKLCALTEQRCDLGTVLPAARAVREQIDWDRVVAETAGNDVAAACLFLLARLGVMPADAPAP
ncbi:hypothetical protein [Actinomycetospora sp. CA-084318]|uniref:hypothetical protein n=1 Tax=Actinomycetospora sp. CA-084318 TaxID=3239892 RepID=UPI003D9667D6